MCREKYLISTGVIYIQQEPSGDMPQIYMDPVMYQPAIPDGCISKHTRHITIQDYCAPEHCYLFLMCLFG